LNRGFRIQYSSALGPYEGALLFGAKVNVDLVKAAAFDSVYMNALAGVDFGGAAGGSDFDPSNKSEAELQRFCQSFMTELSKYVGPDLDFPSMGMGVGEREIGYLYGQYKRINMTGAQKGRGVLWGGQVAWPQAYGWGVAHFAARLVKDKLKGDLEGKRCLITGSGVVACALAEKLLEFGAIPITFSDTSGHIYEPSGMDASKLDTIKKIKADRGARLGRYIVTSTTAKYSEPENIFSIPCDICIPCAYPNEIDESAAQLLAENGCKAIIEGASMPCTPSALAEFRRRSIPHAPYKMTLSAGAVSSGGALENRKFKNAEELDTALKETVDHVYTKVIRTATEFNVRGDLQGGAQIAGFLKVANVMASHGAV